MKTSFTFAGRESDSESGLIYNRARYYDPSIGRFLQKDQKPGIVTQPITVVNAYAYSANNPINVKDPSGNDFWSFLGSALTTVLATIALPIIAMASLAIAIFDPALAASLLSATLNLSLIGEAINLAATGSWATLNFVSNAGIWGPVVENSVIPTLGSIFGRGDDEGGVTFGPVSFTAPGAPDSVIDHELGHQVQYRDIGGWSYVLEGIGQAGSTDYFECQASYLAGGYYTGYNAVTCHDLYGF